MSKLRSQASRSTQYAIRLVRHVLRIACYVFLLTTCSLPGTVRPTVKIGLVAPFEGRYRYVGYDVIYAVQLSLHEVNEGGGIGGYSVELVAYDDGDNSKMATEQARKLSVDPDVIGAIGHFREETTAAALSTYAESNVPLIAPTRLDPTLAQAKQNIYHLEPTRALAQALLDNLQGQDQHQAALLTDGGSLGELIRQEARNQQQRIEPVLSPTNSDWCGEVLSSGARAVFCDTDPVTAGEAISTLREAGWEGQFIGGPALAASDFVAVAGEAAEGTIFVTPWPYPTALRDGEDFVAAYRDISNGTSPGPLALPAYEAAWVLLEALERDIAAHGEPSREGVAAALDDTRRDGLLGRITFDRGRWASAPLYWYRIGPDGTPAPRR